MTAASLKRQLGFWDSVAINIGIVIGVGIFRVPAEVARYIHSPGWMLFAWGLGGLISLTGVLCYAELSSLFPHTGGTYIFLREAYGRLISFLFGWMEFTVLRAGSLAGVAYVFAAYLKNFITYGPGTEKGIAVAAIAFFTLLNVCGLRYGTGVQNVLSSLKVLTLLGISVTIFILKKHDPLLPDLLPHTAVAVAPWYFIAPAMIPVLWGYGGWNESTFMSGEFKDTRRALPWSLVVSIGIITLLYIFINTAYLHALTPEAIRQSKSIASDIFNALLGSQGRLFITAAVLISASGALNSNILTGARIPFAVAQDSGQLSWLGGIHGYFGTPAKALLLNGFWAICLVLWGNFEELLFFTGFAKWFFFTLAGASVFILRAKHGGCDTFRLPGYPGVPIFFTLFALTLFITTIVSEPKAAAFGALLLCLGLPAYVLLHSPRLAKPETRRTRQKFLNLLKLG